MPYQAFACSFETRVCGAMRGIHSLDVYAQMLFQFHLPVVLKKTLWGYKGVQILQKWYRYALMPHLT